MKMKAKAIETCAWLRLVARLEIEQALTLVARLNEHVDRLQAAESEFRRGAA